MELYQFSTRGTQSSCRRWKKQVVCFRGMGYRVTWMSCKNEYKWLLQGFPASNGCSRGGEVALVDRQRLPISGSYEELRKETWDGTEDRDVMFTILKSAWIFKYSLLIWKHYDWKGKKQFLSKRTCGKDMVSVYLQALVYE